MQEGTGLGFHTEKIPQEITISSYVLSEEGSLLRRLL